MRGLLPLVFFLVACEPTPPPSALRAPIVDGTLETGEDAVVAVTAFGAVGLCTGTLIAPNVVLTAKHCVQAPGQDAPYPVTAFTIGVGSEVGATRDYRVRSVDTTPGVYTQSMTTGLAGAIFGVDVALLILREPVEGVTPIRIRRDRPDDQLGQPFTAIGFGQRPDGPAGTKYKGQGIVQAIDDIGIISTAQTICSGDSGGPMIQETPERRVIGVASFGQAGACPSSRDGYNAVWNHLDRIDRAILLGGNCVGLEETCNSLDDDCDGTVDEGCIPLGAACTESSECANAQLPPYLDGLANPVSCVDLGAGSICARACDPTRPRTSCAALEGFAGADVPLDGYYCRRDGCDGFCVLGGAGPASDGTACGSDTECSSLLCLDPGDGASRCLLPCRPGQGECPVDEVCVGSAAGCGGCVGADLVVGGRSLGEPCETEAMCGQSCFDGYCTVSCSAAEPCLAGYRCAAGVCQRGALGGLGDPCEDDSTCGGGTFCAEDAGRRWCTASCEGDGECAEGMACVDSGAGRLCAPTGAILGESCGGGACAGGTCVDDRCTRSCGAGAHCPAGYLCQRSDRGAARCEAIASGCAVSPTRGSPWGLAGLLCGVLVLLAGRRL